MKACRALLCIALLTPAVALAQPIPAGKANPQAPTLNPITPMGAQRGGAIDLTLTGTNLTEPVAVWTSFPAKVTIPSDANNGKNAASLRVRLELPADAPLGFHSLRVATRRGVSNARLFCVDDLPQVLETANTTAAKTAQVLPLPCVVSARIDAETTDYYKVRVAAGQRLSFEVIGRRLGSAFDPQLTLLDAASGKELPGAFSNDAPGLQTDARLSYTFKQAGDVLVAIRDVAYRGGGDFHYRLRVGEFPCATTPLPLAIKRGTRMPVRFAGPFVEGVAPVEVQAPADPVTESLQVAPKGANGLHGWPVLLLVTDLDEQSEKEPNNDPKQANRLTVPGAVTARFEQKDDIDHFVFTAKKGQRWILEAHAAEHLSPTEVYMVLKNDKGSQVLASNPTLAPRLDFTAAADGDYTLAVEHLHSWGGPDEVYRVSVSPYQPEFSLALNLDRWEAMPGAKVSIPIFATRTGYNGPIDVSVVGNGLSGTVTLKPGAAKPNVPAGTLVVTAGDQLPPGPMTFAIQGKATIDGKPVTRLASVRTMVSASMGNLPVPPRAMHTQLALAIGERPPFALSLKLDAADAALGKPLGATVTITNAPGFGEEVALSFEGIPVRPELMSIKVQGAVTTMKLTLMVPATTKPGATQVVAVGTAKYLGRDSILRSPPATVTVKK